MAAPAANAMAESSRVAASSSSEPMWRMRRTDWFN
jgi:hypothetical protein